MNKNFSERASIILLGTVFMSFTIWYGFNIKDKDFSQGQTAKTMPLSIGQKRLQVFVANTPETRTKGLSGKDFISSDEAMLFVFEEPAPYGIWMKDMRFPIDIIWLQETQIDADKDTRINADKKYKLVVVDIKERVLPSTFPEIFTPKTPAKYVLEIESGFAGKNWVKIGDEISF